jgi:hypothetical protein
MKTSNQAASASTAYPYLFSKLGESQMTKVELMIEAFVRMTPAPPSTAFEVSSCLKPHII